MLPNAHFPNNNNKNITTLQVILVSVWPEPEEKDLNFTTTHSIGAKGQNKADQSYTQEQE